MLSNGSVNENPCDISAVMHIYIWIDTTWVSLSLSLKLTTAL